MKSKSKSKSNPFTESLRENEEILWMSIYRTSLSKVAWRIAQVYLGSLAIIVVLVLIAGHMDALSGLAFVLAFLASPIVFAMLFDAWRAPNRPPSKGFAVTPERLLYSTQRVGTGFSHEAPDIHDFPLEEIIFVSMPNPDGSITAPMFSFYYPEWMSEADKWQADDTLAQARIQRFQALERRLSTRKLPRDRSPVPPYAVPLEAVLFSSEVIVWQTAPMSLMRALWIQIRRLLPTVFIFIFLMGCLGPLNSLKSKTPLDVQDLGILFLIGAFIGLGFGGILSLVVLGRFLLTLGQIHWQRDRHAYAITNERILISRAGVIIGVFLDELSSADVEEETPSFYGVDWMTKEDIRSIQITMEEILKLRFQAQQGEIKHEPKEEEQSV